MFVELDGSGAEEDSGAASIAALPSSPASLFQRHHFHSGLLKATPEVYSRALPTPGHVGHSLTSLAKSSM